MRQYIDGRHRSDYLDEPAVAHLALFVAFFVGDDFAFESRDWDTGISPGHALCVTGITDRVGVVIICLGFARSTTTMHFEVGCHRGRWGVILVAVAGSSVSAQPACRAVLVSLEGGGMHGAAVRQH